MRTIFAFAVALILGGAFMLPHNASAATYYYSTPSSHQNYSYSYNSRAHLDALLAQLHELERQLALIRGGSYYTGDPYYGTNRNELSRIDVDLHNDDYAEVEIRYRDGDRDSLLFDAETREEVIDYLIDETRHSRSQIIAVIRFDADFDDEDDHEDIDDIRSINVDIRSNDARVEVRFEDGDRDTFIVDETRKSDIIDEIADELDLDEDDVEDIVDWDDSNNDDDVESIDVEIDEDDNNAEARVEFEDGDETTYFYDTDDEDEIIEELADDLDMDEDDVEDIIDFDYRD